MVENIIRVGFLSELESKERNKKGGNKKKMNTKEKDGENWCNFSAFLVEWCKPRGIGRANIPSI